jgi:hypothetical protein
MDESRNSYLKAATDLTLYATGRYTCNGPAVTQLNYLRLVFSYLNVINVVAFKSVYRVRATSRFPDGSLEDCWWLTKQ